MTETVDTKIEFSFIKETPNGQIKLRNLLEKNMMDIAKSFRKKLISLGVISEEECPSDGYGWQLWIDYKQVLIDQKIIDDFIKDYRALNNLKEVQITCRVIYLDNIEEYLPVYLSAVYDS